MSLAALGIVLSFCAPLTAPTTCSCIERPLLTTELGVANTVKQFGAVFEGRVVAVAHDSALYELLASIVIDRGWKGALADTVVVRTSLGIGSCGVAFRVATRYLVFASEGTRGWMTWLCSPTTMWSSDAERIAQLLGPPVRRP